jgi:hypothetical protein
MNSLKVRVQGGQLVGDAPAGLAEGTELELCLAEPDEEMTEEQARELNRALEAAWRSLESGRARPVADVIAELRALR